MPTDRHPDFYRALLEDSPVATLVYGSDHLCRWLSPGFARLAPRVVSFYLGQKVDALLDDIHPDDRGLAEEAWDAFWVTPGRLVSPAVPFLFRMRVRSGTYRLVEVTGANRLGDGVVDALVLHFTQVVDRKRAEDLLLSERERLLVTLRSIGDGVIATDLEGRITLMNTVAESLTEWTQAEALGHSLPEVFRIVQAALVSKNGRVSVIEDSAAPIRDSSGAVIGSILVFRDVTEARKTEAELHKMQKLESIGVLAGGIAHDFNNLLSAILGNASLGTLLVEPLHPVQDLLTGIVQASKRASGLTQQLLTFSKGGTPVLESVRVPSLIEESARFLLFGTAECRFEFEENLFPALADPGQLGQVVQNLVLNARQAREDGVLVVRGRGVRLEGSGSPPLPPGDYVRLEFCDQGPGIAPEHLEKIFEPYFTTKPGGTGLGLAVVWSIVKNHGGWVQVESRLGEGTTFTVWLPAAPRAEAAAPSPARKGAALVMDDEPDPRRTMVVMLRHLGFECRDARSGEDALRQLAEAGPADLALVDLTVKGGMGGREVLPLLKKLNPGIRVIVTSGYSIDPVMSDFRGFGFDGVLRKPFTLADLTLAIDEAFSGA